MNLQLQAQTETIQLMHQNKIAPPVFNNLLKSTVSDCRILIQKLNNADQWIERHLSEIDYKKTEYENVFYLRNINLIDLQRLAKHDTVIFIDVALRKAQDEKILDSLDLSVNFINKVHYKFPKINGESLVISIKERPFDSLDIDFYNRILFKSKISTDISSHASSMATIVAGAGNSGTKGLGAAPGAFIVSASYENLSPENTETLLNEEVSVQNHSYGIGEIENYYGIESHLYDIQTHKIPYLLHVFSSGNIGNRAPETGIYKNIEGYANLTGQFKASKNSLCVGSVNKFNKENYFSCKGPTYDGRLKPEVVAFGADGTSDAAALVSGISAIAQHAYFMIYNNLPPSELIKCALINSTFDIGNKGPDYATGFGGVNAFEALKTIVDTNFFIESISSNELKEYNIEIPENKDQLKVTLSWKDPPGLPGGKKALTNDLDLLLIDEQSSKTYLPWVLSSFPDLDSLSSRAVRKRDTLNNVEQISIENVHTGNYKIIVQANNIINSQQYCLAYNVKSNISEWIFPLANNKLLAGEKILLKWNWTGEASSGTIEFKKIEDNIWQTIQENTDLTAGFYNWSTPKINSPIQFRIRNKSKQLVSDTLLLSESVIPKVGFNCDDELMLYWEKINSAISYNLWQLVDKKLEKKINITDTIAVLNKDEVKTKHYAVSPVYNDFEGLRGNSMNFENQNIDCYIKSFYPISIVTNQKAQLQLDLASTYELKNASLQRLDNKVFNNIFTLSPLKGSSLTFEDIQPNENSNTYRICLKKNDGKVMYSHEEIVFLNKPEEIFIYPNPTLNSEFIYLISNDISSDITIFNMSGQIIRKYENVQGVIKAIDINLIESGVYILETKNSFGKRYRRKIIIVK